MAAWQQHATWRAAPLTGELREACEAAEIGDGVVLLRGVLVNFCRAREETHNHGMDTSQDRVSRLEGTGLLNGDMATLLSRYTGIAPQLGQEGRTEANLEKRGPWTPGVTHGVAFGVALGVAE